MEIVYYSANEFCPVKDYLIKNYIKDKILIEIRKKIEHIKRMGFSKPPIAKPLIGYNFFEIMQSNGSKNIRILFFFYHEKMILLHAFDKPKSYDNSKIDKIIKKNYDKAQAYLKDFLINPNNYERYI